MEAIFQPTLPARGATKIKPPAYYDTPISTHAPRTGSDGTAAAAATGGHYFNPRSPHGERPISPASRRSDLCAFQPTLPARGATLFFCGFSARKRISTHAPRTGSDGIKHSKEEETINFNPRSPHGERRATPDSVIQAMSFQPTLPARGATLFFAVAVLLVQFQPTLPARGATHF